MNPVYDKLVKCYESVKQKIDFQPEVAIVLGSGLGDYADDIRVEAELDYHDIEGFPVSTVPGHAGKFIFGYVGGVPVVCMKGRVHYYEGYPISDVVLPTRLMKLMGAKVLFLTNASGGCASTRACGRSPSGEAFFVLFYRRKGGSYAKICSYHRCKLWYRGRVRAPAFRPRI